MATKEEILFNAIQFVNSNNGYMELILPDRISHSSYFESKNEMINDTYVHEIIPQLKYNNIICDDPMNRGYRIDQDIFMNMITTVVDNMINVINEKAEEKIKDLMDEKCAELLSRMIFDALKRSKNADNNNDDTVHNN